MLTDIGYNRTEAVNYAKIWAFERNPRYLNFDKMGGDCTNFASQCIFAGCNVMNHTPTFGWYYYDSNRRSPSWSGVQYLYNFLVTNKKAGPYAVDTDKAQLELGDIIQFGTNENHFYHSPVVVGIDGDNIFVAAHTYDAFMRPLDTYEYDQIRYLHIVGARKYM